MKSYRNFNDAACNSNDIMNPKHQLPHAPIAKSLTQLCRAISLHQIRDGLQRSANCDCWAEARIKEKAERTRKAREAKAKARAGAETVEMSRVWA